MSIILLRISMELVRWHRPTIRRTKTFSSAPHSEQKYFPLEWQWWVWSRVERSRAWWHGDHMTSGGSTHGQYSIIQGGSPGITHKYWSIPSLHSTPYPVLQLDLQLISFCCQMVGEIRIQQYQHVSRMFYLLAKEKATFLPRLEADYLQSYFRAILVQDMNLSWT